MAEKKITTPEDKLRLYQRLLEISDGPEEKSNFGSAYTAINGNMYSMISKYGVVGIRLPEPELTAFMEKYHTELYRADPAWPASKLMAAVPDELLADTEALRPYMELSYQHAKSLRPKLPKRREK